MPTGICLPRVDQSKKSATALWLCPFLPVSKPSWYHAGIADTYRRLMYPRLRDSSLFMDDLEGPEVQNGLCLDRIQLFEGFVHKRLQKLTRLNTTWFLGSHFALQTRVGYSSLADRCSGWRRDEYCRAPCHVSDHTQPLMLGLSVCIMTDFFLFRPALVITFILDQDKASSLKLSFLEMEASSHNWVPGPHNSRHVLFFCQSGCWPIMSTYFMCLTHA